MEFFPKRKILEQRERARESHGKERTRRTKKLAEVNPEVSEPLEKIINRGNRLSRHLDAYCAHYDKIAGLNARRFSFDPFSFEHFKDSAARGLSSALQFLAGGALALTAPLGRVPGHVVDDAAIAIAASFGAWFASSRLFEAIDYFSPASRAEISAHGRKRGIRVDSNEDTDQEKVTEYSLRRDMAQLQLDIFSRQRDIETALARHRNLLDRNTAEEIEIEVARLTPEEWKAEDIQQLSVVNHYLEQLIPKQEELLKKVKRYEILSSLHEEDRYKKIFGVVAATGMLIGGESMSELVSRGPEHAAEKMRDFFDMFTKPRIDGSLLQRTLSPVFSSLSGTLFALASGMLKVIRETDQSQERSEMVRQRLQEMERDVTKMQSFKNYVASELRKYVAVPPAFSTAVDEAKAKSISEEDALREQWRQEFNRVIAGVEGAVHGVSADFDFPPFVEHLPPEAPALAVGTVPLECPARAVTPPPFNQIESSSLRREVDPQIIVDLMNIAGRKLTVPTSSIGWVDAPNVVSNAFVEDAGHDISEAALDEAIRYLGELDDRLTAHHSVRNFQQSHLARLVALRSDMQTRLYASERATYRDLIIYGSPSAFRAAILRRSRIADFPDDRIDDISQEQFEESIRQWMQHKSTRDHDRTSLRRFLDTCQETLNAIPSHVPTRDEKARIVKRVGDVLDEFLPEVAMPDPEQVSAWGRRIDEISALFNRIQSAPNYDRRQRVPELLAGEPFVPSDVLREVRFADGHLGDLRIMSVDTRGILGSYVDRAAWIVQDRDRIVELAAPLIQTPTPEVLQNFFMSRVRRGDREHLEENIQLLRIPGPNPRKSIYFVYRGIQHVAAARVAGLQRIIARVYELRAQDSAGNIIVTTKYRDRYEEWLELKEAGLIDGKLVSQQDLVNQYAWLTPENSDRKETPTPVVAKIRFQTVPWLIWSKLNPHDDAPMRSISEITNLYRKLYAPPQGSTETGPLDKLKTADGRKLEPKYLTEFKYLHSLITRKGMRTA